VIPRSNSDPASLRRRCATHAAVLAGFAVAALLYTWPLATRPATHYLVWSSDMTEPYVDQPFLSWVLATDVHQLASDPRHLFESNNLHPFRRTLTFSEHLLGVALLVLPVQYVGNNPVLTYNIALLVVLTLTGWGVFLLVRDLAGSAAAGMLAGLLFIYSPFHWINLSEIFMIASHWTPIALFALGRTVRTCQWRWALALGVAAAAQVWTSLHHSAFLALGLATGLPVLLVLSADARAAMPKLLIAGIVAVALSVPLVLPYWTMASDMDLHSRGLALRLEPWRFAPPWRHPIDYLTARIASGERRQTYGTLAPWIFLLVAAPAAVMPRGSRRVDPRLVAMLVVGGIANWLFALGPQRWHGLPSLYLFLAEHVPGLGIVRTPTRATSYVYLILCVLAGTALGALLQRLRAWPVRALLTVVLVALIVVEAGWRSVPLAAAPSRASAVASALETLEAGCAIAELPASFEGDALALFRSTTHWRPLINGYSGFFAIEQSVSHRILNRFPAEEALQYLWAAGGCAVVVRWPDYVQHIVEASRARGMTVDAADAEVFIRLPPPPPPPDDGPELPRDGWSVTGTSDVDPRLAVDGDLDTLWLGSVAERRGPDSLTIDMGPPAEVHALAVELGRHLRRYLVTYRVEGSLDGQSWTVLAESKVAVPPLASYRHDPRRVRQRIGLRPTVVRWLRLGPRGVARDLGFRTWGVAELRVYGRPQP
jgi:hypothetical protein